MKFTGKSVLLIAVAVQVFAAEPEPVYVQVEMEGVALERENCEGGDWHLGWKGPIYVESGPLADLLLSYTAFDSSHPGQPAMAPVNFSVAPVTCWNDRGEVEMQARTTAKPSNAIQLTVSLAQNPAFHSPAFIFSADDLGHCDITTEALNYSHEHILASVNTGLFNRLNPAFDISLQDLEQGFNKSYHFSGMVVGIAPLCMGATLKQGTVRLRYKSGDQDPEVAMDACLHLAKNEVRAVTATGTPEGGSYRFLSAPGAVFEVTASGNSAQLKGATPGSGDVQVDYAYKGKSASASAAGSVVELLGINGGGAIPKLGLFDRNGKKIETLYSFPLQLNPTNGMVQMTLEQDSLASVINSSTQIQIQPIKPGKTQLQAKTLCGTNIGSPIAIEIVRCDDDVKAQLQTQQQDYKKRLDHIVKRITQTTGDSEFNRAATEIADTTKEMAIKTGESIVGTLSFGETQQVSFAAKKGIQLSQKVIVNSEQLAVAGTLYDSYNAVNDAQAAFSSPGDLNAQAKMLIGTAVLVAQNSAIALGKTYGETYLAAQKFGKDLGILYGAAEQLANLEPQHNQLIKDYLAILDRIQQCAEQPVEIEEPKPLPREPDIDPPKPEEQPPESNSAEEPDDSRAPDEPINEPTDEPPEELPPAEEPPKKVYGLACRIQDLRAPQLAVELRNLVQRAQQQQAQIAAAQAELAQWQAAIATMDQAKNASPNDLISAFSTFKAAQENFMLNTAKRGAAQLDYLMDTEECPEKLEIKFDQIRAHYN